MRCLLVAINSKYIHSNPAVYLLRECALRDLKQKQIFGVEVELAEYTINHHASEIFDDIYLHHADLVCFSCYIWNIEYVRQLVRNLKNLCPNVKIWVGGPEVSYDCDEFPMFASSGGWNFVRRRREKLSNADRVLRSA